MAASAPAPAPAAAPAPDTRFRVLITGSQGKVGKHVVRALKAHGALTIGLDLARGEFDTYEPDGAWPEVYWQCDLLDAGAVYSAVASFKPDAVVHVAAIPDPTHTPPHVVFTNNIGSTFNVVEACVKLGVPRLVNISSETVPGFFFHERVVPGVSGVPLYCPVDEKHAMRPQDPYALSKLFGEQLCDAACLRSAQLTVVSVRPSWCQDEGNVERNLGPLIRDHSLYQEGMWAYVIITDLAAAIALAATKKGLPAGHEVIYIAAEDNIGGRDLKAAVDAHWGAGVVPCRALARPDASGLDCAKAQQMLGWRAQKTWRDFLGADGKKKAAV
jgi:nucleoside-diphosphate-sugar epimerase